MPARLTPQGVMLLALLREADMHPYEMRRLLIERHDDRLVSTTPGAIYHTIGRLAERGFVTEVGVDRDGNRPERTTYTLTESGRAIVDAWLRHTLPRDGSEGEFRVALAECHNLPQAEVRELLQVRHDLLTTERDAYDAGLAKAGRDTVPPIYLVEVQRQRHLVQAELDWLDEFLTQLGTPSLGWPE